MQHIQDKEFDRLVKTKFADAEVQPSANLWNNIEQELKPVRRPVLSSYWMAAAVVLMAVIIGLLVPKTEKIRLHAPTLTQNKVMPAIIAPAVKKEIALTEDKDESTPLIIAPRIKVDVQKDLMAMQPKQPVTRPDYKAPELIEQHQKEAQKETIVPVKQVITANANVPEVNHLNVITETEEPEHRGIRNVGDLVNLVVNKVDKREKKFLQFNTDDDNSSLVGINIGIIRINKRSN